MLDANSNIVKSEWHDLILEFMCDKLEFEWGLPTTLEYSTAITEGVCLDYTMVQKYSNCTYT